MTTLAPRPPTSLGSPLRDLGLNTIAFGMIIVVQQILVLPGLSRLTTAVGFSEVILLITISTIVVNVIGTEASKVSLIRSEAYRSREIPWDAPRLVLICSSVICALIAIVTVAADIPWQLSLQYAVITLLGIARSYWTTPDKYAGAFHRVVVVHGAYAAGAVAGLLLVPTTGTPYVPFLLAESVAIVAVVLYRLHRREVALTFRRTEEFATTRHQFVSLALIALLINAVSYIDRLAITPLVGASALAVYYSASALSSSLSLITNPVGNAMLARLGRLSDERRHQLFSRGLFFSLPLVVVFWAGSIAIAYVGLVVLYPTHLGAAVSLLVPVSLAAAFTNVTSLLSPLLQRFLPAQRLLRFYVPYTAVYLISITAFSALWGLNGFAWASALANSMLFVMYILQLRHSSRDSAAAPPNAAPRRPGTCSPSNGDQP